MGRRQAPLWITVAAFFNQSFMIKGDLIPEATAEGILSELQAQFARHSLYSAEENMEIDKVVPVAASVKTKLGRGVSSEY